jgi:hypothetical protein
MATDVNADLMESPNAYGLSAPAVDLQTELTRAYMSGNGAEVERILALIQAADIVLPPKTRAAA